MAMRFFFLPVPSVMHKQSQKNNSITNICLYSIHMYMDTYHVDLLSRKLHDMVFVLSSNTDMERTAAFARATPRTDDARKGWYANHAHANGHESGHDASWCEQLLDLFAHTSSRLT